jgi:undecaprenyl-diphosphatase
MGLHRQPLDRAERGPLSWLGAHELATLAVTTGVAASAWAFARIAEMALGGETEGFDRRLLLALRDPTDSRDPIGPAWIEELGRDFTALGGLGVLSLVTVATTGWLVLERKRGAALLVVVAVGGGLLLSTLLKHAFDRPRPDLVPHDSAVYTASFPSGHSMMAAVTYLTLAALLARVQPRKRLKSFLLIAGVLATVLVGVSRVYVGVHWPTDVLGGWTAGAAWAMVCWLVARWLQRRGDVEPETG